MFVPYVQRRLVEFRVWGEPLLDEYLRFVVARCRPDTLLAQFFDLKVWPCGRTRTRRVGPGRDERAPWCG